MTFVWHNLNGRWFPRLDRPEASAGKNIPHGLCHGIVAAIYGTFRPAAITPAVQVPLQRWILQSSEGVCALSV